MAIIQSVWLKFSSAAADEKGVTAIEYSLIAALVAVFLVTSLTALGTGIAGEFGKVVTAFGK